MKSETAGGPSPPNIKCSAHCIWWSKLFLKGIKGGVRSVIIHLLIAYVNETTIGRYMIIEFFRLSSLNISVKNTIHFE